MTVCPTCRSELAAGTDACPKCKTLATGHATAKPVLFTPGQIVANRYRIVSLLGRGGMGSVYRADDLRLGLPVALKFLSVELADDPAALERLHAEVRTARQVSHPHVCRVHDIDMVEGQYFLTMEYVDGEDLAVLLRRIGRLPPDKALEIARQLGAGLQAAHDRGVVHRDLKPGNIMLDGHGRVRITDFGLAVSSGEAATGGAGTPAYMAPEQTLGRPATARSDVYALGLVLYEVCTGRHPFAAKTLDEWLTAHRELAPPNPRTFAPDLDPQIERVILRCLAKDPGERPASAGHVAHLLPGGDALAAAIAIGETPSPEVVAEATGTRTLSHRAAWALLGAIVLLVTLMLSGHGVSIDSQQPFGPSVEVLADRASRLLGDLAIDAPVVDRAAGFASDPAYLDWEGDPVRGNERWQRLQKGQPYYWYFWYRQSPVSLEPHPTRGQARILLAEPPATVPGMSHVITDVLGRLVEFGTVPAVQAARPMPAAADQHTDWSPLFRAAGLDPLAFTRSEPQWTPPTFADERCAWTGTLADHRDLPVRVEAAALAGHPVSFRVVAPWNRGLGDTTSQSSSEWIAAGMLMITLLGLILLGALVLVRSNLRAGRGDRRGALRLAMFQASVSAAIALLSSDLPMTAAGFTFTFFLVVNGALFAGALAWALYLALEPAVRRRQPRLLVGWTRLLSGRGLDAIVGRDLLLGTTLGLCCSLAGLLGGWLKYWTDHPLPPNHYAWLVDVGALRHELAAVAGFVTVASLATLAIVAAFVLLRRVLPGTLFAGASLWAMVVGISYVGGTHSWPMLAATGLSYAVLLGTVVRLGLLAGAVSFFVQGLTTYLPLARDFELPQGRLALLSLAAIGGVAAWGVIASVRDGWVRVADSR